MTRRRHLVGEPQVRGEQLDHVGCPRIVASDDERRVASPETAQVVPDLLDRLEIEPSLPTGITDGGRGQLAVHRDRLGGGDDGLATKRRVRLDHLDGDAVAGVPSQLTRHAAGDPSRSASRGNTDRAPAPTRHARSRSHRAPGPRCSDRDHRVHGAGATGAAPSGRRCPRRSVRARCRENRTSPGRGSADRVGSRTTRTGRTAVRAAAIVQRAVHRAGRGRSRVVGPGEHPLLPPPPVTIGPGRESTIAQAGDELRPVVPVHGDRAEHGAVPRGHIGVEVQRDRQRRVERTTGRQRADVLDRTSCRFVEHHRAIVPTGRHLVADTRQQCAPSAGFEPARYGLEGRCSVQTELRGQHPMTHRAVPR